MISVTEHARRTALLDFARSLLAGAALLLVSGPVLAQTASQVTPQTFEPQLRKKGRGIVIPDGAGPAAPAGAGKLEIKIADVTIEGGLPGLVEDGAKVKAALSGKTVTAAALYAAASRLQAAYSANSATTLSRRGADAVFLPRQQQREPCLAHGGRSLGEVQMIDNCTIHQGAA